MLGFVSGAAGTSNQQSILWHAGTLLITGLPVCKQLLFHTSTHFSLFLPARGRCFTSNRCRVCGWCRWRFLTFGSPSIFLVKISNVTTYLIVAARGDMFIKGRKEVDRDKQGKHQVSISNILQHPEWTWVSGQVSLGSKWTIKHFIPVFIQSV